MSCSSLRTLVDSSKHARSWRSFPRLKTSSPKHNANVLSYTASLSTGPDSHFSMDRMGLPQNDPIKGELVYLGPLASLVKGVKMFSISTSVIGLSLQPYLLLHAGDHNVVATVAVGGVIGFFIFATPLLIHWITKKYVTDLYFNKESGQYTAATITFFLRRKELAFKSSEVVVPDIPGMFTFLIAKGKPLFMDPQMFLSREAYIRLMGYDKPLEWELPKQEDKKSE